MRVAIKYAVDVTDEYRRAIRHHYGEPGLATGEELHQWFRVYGESMDDDLPHDHRDCCYGEAKVIDKARESDA